MTERANGVGRVKGYKELLVWQRSVDLAKQVYVVTRCWPADEKFGLTSQVRRAAVSISANLAEGQGRFGRGEFAHFVSVAHGSLCELEAELTIAQEIGILPDDQIRPLMAVADEVGKMLRSLHRSLLEKERKIAE